jgi:hypothetical protein
MTGVGGCGWILSIAFGDLRMTRGGGCGDFGMTWGWVWAGARQNVTGKWQIRWAKLFTAGADGAKLNKSICFRESNNSETGKGGDSIPARRRTLTKASAAGTQRKERQWIFSPTWQSYPEYNSR